MIIGSIWQLHGSLHWHRDGAERFALWSVLGYLSTDIDKHAASKQLDGLAGP